MRDNAKRRADRLRRKRLFAQLKLQADILYESYNDDAKATVMINRMMLILLDIVGRRKMNNEKRQALADHFIDCALNKENIVVELGGPGDRDVISLSGDYNIDDLAKRITWSEARTEQTIEVEHESVAA